MTYVAWSVIAGEVPTAAKWNLLGGNDADFNTRLTSDWRAAGETWTYASSDDPTFTFTISGDLTTKYSPGMRIKLTQGTIKYFLITKVAFSAGTTTITVYGGTDYDLIGVAITLPFYATEKAPVGFPLDPIKWTETMIDTTDQTQSSPVSGTWYNMGVLKLDIPIGAWRVSYSTGLQGNTTNSAVLQTTLSTSNAAASDNEFTTLFQADGSAAVNFLGIRDKYLTVTTKTRYYLNERYAAGAASNMGTVSASYGAPSIIRAICAYL